MPLCHEDRSKTAFQGANRVLWEWIVVPFGQKNAPLYFQRKTDEAFKDSPFFQYYIGDIVIRYWSMEEHLPHLETVFSVYVRRA